jgi:RHS repeat-associated protein
MAVFSTPAAGRWGMGSRALRYAGAVVAVFALMPSAVANAAYVKTTPNAAATIWQPGGIQQTASVPGASTTQASRHTVTMKAPPAVAAPRYKPSQITWPSGSATVVLSHAAASGAGKAARVRPGAAKQAGSLPITLAGADNSSSAAREASVSFVSRQTTAAAGIKGVIFAISRADGGADPSRTQVTLDYTSFAQAYGGGYADRLKLVQLPACALTTPKLAKCQVQTPLAFTNNQKAGTLTATLPVAGGGAAAQSKAAAQPAITVVAATSGASGSVGSYTATSLSQTGSWSAGGPSGAFTYSYPISLPPTVGGSAPSVTLSYNSASVDGRTSATNSQASWIGDGWDYAPGYVERSYQPCSQDGITNSGDECWAGNAVTLSLNGQNETLVDSGGTWKLQDDDGATVTPLTGQTNGAYNGEGWEVVEPDGTQYYFGANPDSLSSAPAKDSTWTQPVYCPHSGDGPANDACYNSSTGTNSFASNMAWRWNLDYVIDPHGNLITYTWTPETNYYKRGYDGGANAGTNTLYTRGGYLSQIAYGYRVSDAVAGTSPLDTVSFSIGERCTPGYANCNWTYLSANLSNNTITANWPDTPADLICLTITSTCTNYSPSYFETDQLHKITTSVLVGTTPQTVDTYALSEYFPDPQAGLVSDPTKSYDSPSNPGDGTVAVMWLGSIQRTGNDTLGGGTAVTAPPTTFYPNLMPNRVDGTTTGFAALYRPRMDWIITPSGEQIVVSYSTPQCTSTNHPTADSNTTNCFPQYWTPSTATSPILDWFNTYQVTEVTDNDLVAAAAGAAAWSQAQTTEYSYSSPAWHRDDSPLTENKYRTWNDFRGFKTVTTTVGTSSIVSVPTQSTSIYMQGMNGDYLANGTQRSACVNDNVGDCVTDAPQLQGQLLETDTLSGVGGTVEKRTVNGPWTYTQTGSQAQAEVGTSTDATQPATTLPNLTAQMLATSQSRSYQLWHDGTWKILPLDVTYDAHGRVATSDAKGDGTTAVPEVCTATSYATSTSSNPNMLDYPDEVTSVQGPCGTAMTSSTAVSDTQTFYDNSTSLGSLTGAGDITESQQARTYSSGGSPDYKTLMQAAYDSYGRVTSSTDADGNTTTTAYTAPGASPDIVTTTNPMGWQSSTTLDPARGLTLASVDVNQELTSYTYDGLGEVTAAWSPLHAKANSAPADATYAYSETGGNVTVTTNSNGTVTITSNGTPSTVSTTKLLDDGTYTDSTTIVIYDGQLRPIQTQAPMANGDVGRLITDTHYNSLGQISKTSSAYPNTDVNAPTKTLFVAVDDTHIPAEAEPFYDGMGRTVKTETVAFGINQYATTTAYPGTDQTDVTPPGGGTATSTFTDALGRTAASWKYTTAAPTDKPTDAVVTNYTYTPAGKQATIADAAGNQWSYTYNLLGQQTGATDPDAGTSSTSYSPGGEVLSTTDANGTTLTYTYDKLARKQFEYNTTGNLTPGATNEVAAWTYDSLKKGQPTSVTTYTNPTQGTNDPANTYTETQLGYTALYQSKGESVTIPSSQGALAGTYQSTNIYTTGISLLAAVQYGAYGGLPSETVTLGYNTAGVLDGYSGLNAYLNLATYNVYGQVLQTNFGPSNSQMDRTETYDAATGRLLTQSDQIQLQSVGSTLDDTTYTYDHSGELKAESDTQLGVATPDTQCFNYNHLGELSSAFTSTDAVTATSGTSAQIDGIGACNDTSPVAGKVTGGPAPSWQSYTYDSLGDRVQEINHDTSVSSTTNNITQTLAYNGYNAATGASTVATTPNAVTSTATAGPTGTTTSNYAYFATGAVKTRTGQSFTYTPQGQTATVTNTSSNTTSTYTYDASGALLLQNDPAANQTILYLPWGEQLTLNTGNGQVSGQRYYTESPDGLVVVRSANGTINYEGDTPQGTATLDVNAATLAYTFRYYDPYGNQRGTPPSSWPDQHSYLGQPQDPTTSLDLLGARQYDPATGRFLSVDPILETGDQRQMNGYSYAADNPVNGSDPNGTRFQCPTGDPSCNAGLGSGKGSGGSPGDTIGSDLGDLGGDVIDSGAARVNISEHVIAESPNDTAQLLLKAWEYIIAQRGQPATTQDEAGDWYHVCLIARSSCIASGMENVFGSQQTTAFLGGDGLSGEAILQGGILLTGASVDSVNNHGASQLISLSEPNTLTNATASDMESVAQAAFGNSVNISAEDDSAPGGDSAPVEVVGPGEVKTGDVYGEVVVRGGTIEGDVYGTVVVTEGGVIAGNVNGDVIQIGNENVIGGEGRPGANVVRGSVSGDAIQTGRLFGDVTIDGRTIFEGEFESGGAIE